MLLGSFILLFSRVQHHKNTNKNMDETQSTIHYLTFVITSYALVAFKSKTHQELLAVFHLDEPPFISLVINLVLHHLKW